MNRTRILGLARWGMIAALLVSFPRSSLAGEQMTGRQIMEKQKQLHESKDEDFKQDMLLIDRNNNTSKREVANFYLKTPEKLTKTMIIFLSPADVRGTGLLTWEQKGRDDDQWLYLPASGKERRIA
ncbi:MAG: outer membrane lipoprotein-sorting protein, partial [Deltaproteobacteria bacterium]|nr:outer membrane lipoprotein-sorting protein [Deltaproteobacteria bacterium]